MSEESLNSTLERFNPRGLAAAIARNAAFQDWFILTFHTYMLMRAYGAPDGPHAVIARPFALTLWLITISGIVLARGEVIPAGRARAYYYRVALFLPMVSSYFELGHLLPSLRPVLLDPELHAIDRLIFGITPSIYLARWNTPAIVEWVSFFYFSYFGLMIVMLIPALFFDNGPRLQALFTGALMVCGLGHIGYTLVPGMGPWMTIAFDEPLHGAYWWGRVLTTVESAGSQLDIFPSLHTAYPTFFTLHAFGHRKTLAFKFTWPVIAFFAANMIFATVFLRWHWGIDVIFGLALGCFARWVAIRLTEAEPARNENSARQASWESI